MENIRFATRRLAVLGMMLAVIVVLSVIEHSLPPIPFLPPSVRLGVSNVVTMYALFFIGNSAAFTLAMLKSLFVLFTRGGIAGLLSFCGGILSICVLVLLTAIFKDRISYLLLSIFGAISHNIGQIAAASVVLHSNIMLYYLPALLVSGVLLGTVTGILLRVAMPALTRAFSLSRGAEE